MTPPLGRRDALALVALLLLAAALPLAMAAAAGAVGVPSNDDWIYELGAAGLYGSGSAAMPGHTAAAVGQLALVQPLLWLSGGASWAYTAFGLLAGALGVGAAYLLARWSGLGPGAGALAGLLLVACPGFARETATFMTDVPALSLELLSLLLGAVWLRGGRRSALAASLAVGVLGVTVREFAIAAPAAVLVVSWARSRPAGRPLLLAAFALTAAAVLTVLTLLGSPAVHGGIGAPAAFRLYLMGPALVTLAAFLLPALLLAIGRRLATIRPFHLVYGLVLVGLAFAIPTLDPLVGQMWMANGLVGDGLRMGPRDRVIPQLAWTLSLALAVAAAVLLATLTVRWAGRRLAGVGTLPAAWVRFAGIFQGPMALLLVFAVGYAAEIAVYVSMAAYPLDRYLWPMAPVLAVILLRDVGGDRSPRWSRVLGGGALAWLGASALLIAANSFAYDAARWRAGEAAVAMGYVPETVDAGYEWVGYHTGGRPVTPPPSYGVTWYDDGYLPAAPCAFVSNGPLQIAGYRLVRVDQTPYRQYLLAGPFEPLYLYGAESAACPVPPTP